MQKLTKYLCGIVQQAAKITNKSFNIYIKDELGDIVTDIDKEVETFLIEKLNQKYPEFDIVSEEFNPNHSASSYCFVIDPIDGTINFAAGLPLWGIQIAALANAEIVASVIYLPKLDELYYADCDGAFLNGKRLEITVAGQDRKRLFSVDGKSLPRLLQKGENVNHRNYRHFGAASVAYAWTAAGRHNGYCLCVDNKWDYMPGMYLVKMAGGVVKDEPGHHAAATNQDMLDYFDQFTPVELANNSTESMTDIEINRPIDKTKKATKSAKVAKNVK